MRLTRNEFAILSKLLDRALDLSAGERAGWLAALHEPFPGARVVLQRMLDQAGNADDFLTALPLLDARPANAGIPTAGLGPGARIGSYRLAREIGEGGMSTVWLAHRTDELKERPVALKLPHLHVASARFRERFSRERDILARLSHPHIAHLYDAGISQQGQPYLVMEFVEGQELKKYVVRQDLDLAGRLKLFLQVLEALSYAHQKGVIHRDIKPSNILVRDGGHAVLLDFGIAKLLVEGQAAESDLTQLGGAVLTLNYASPEQLRGEALSPLTDVYSLGVVLYELLCGRRPHESDTHAARSRGEIERAILSADPERPSTIVRRQGVQPGAEVSPEKMSRALRGDLDTIVLKALRAAPVERYPSCDAFAEDLQRYLRGEPIRARGNSRGYLTRRWAQRHRSALFAIGSAVLALTAVAVIWLDTRRTQHLMQTDAGLARPSIAVLPFDNLSGDSANDYLSQGIQDEVLTHLANVSGLQVLSRRATEGFAKNPDRIKAAAAALGVGNVLEGSVQKTGDRLRVNVELIEAATEHHLWAESFDRTAQDIFGVERDIAESVATRLKARLLPAEHTAVATVDTQNVEAHTADLWGRFYLAKRDDASLRKAVEYFNEAIRLDPGYAMALTDLSTASFYLANSLEEPEAAPLRAQARNAAQRALRLSPNLAEGHSALGWVMLYFDWNVAGAEHELSLAARLAPNSLRAKIGLANLYAVLGELEPAITTMNEARMLDPLSATVLTTLSNYSMGLERYDAAAAWCRKVLELDANAAGCHGNLAIIAVARGDSALAEREAQLEPDQDWKDFTATLVAQRDASQEAAERALQAFIRRHERDSPFWIAELYAFRGDADDAFVWLERSRQTRDVGTIEFLQSPFFLRFRTDERYRDFRDAMGLTRPKPT